MAQNIKGDTLGATSSKFNQSRRFILWFFVSCGFDYQSCDLYNVCLPYGGTLTLSTFNKNVPISAKVESNSVGFVHKLQEF